MGCDIHFYVERKTKHGWELVGNEGDFYNGRNYLLFAILADVRNYHSEIYPISQPKGFPDDVSSFISKKLEQWGGDWHSESYLTLSEILTYDWTQTYNESGRTTIQKYFYYLANKKWNKKQQIEYEWKQGKVISSEEADKLFEKHIQTDILDDLNVDYTQQIPYTKGCEYFWMHTIPEMLTLVIDNDLDSVRAVFAFDN